MRMDHLVVSCTDLEQGATAIEHLLGVPLEPGGQHPKFGTHNRLLSLGPAEYFEVIAVNPSAPAPGRPRWFDLDRFAGPPRLSHWALRCDDAEAVQGALGFDETPVLELSRGDLRWQMAVPEDGRIAFDGAAPALLSWPPDVQHPAERLPDRGCRLTRLEVIHPDAAALTVALDHVLDPRIVVLKGPAKQLRAQIETPGGSVWIS
ncbi:hypothetical protein ACMU_06060 [Actibacterium mucosum KCTC 23349]|uniref:Glyoxalase-like domain-containing protein n=1 Tax=Actibacterium mucosum KCTC 23349 TaxID=1454373 RepID=A0A037ZLJ0_9RHOB|nr:hypothetical protein ACMU_06060 [Actibacterium mucosum KCTC 23349]